MTHLLEYAICAGFAAVSVLGILAYKKRKLVLFAHLVQLFTAFLLVVYLIERGFSAGAAYFYSASGIGFIFAFLISLMQLFYLSTMDKRLFILPVAIPGFIFSLAASVFSHVQQMSIVLPSNGSYAFFIFAYAGYAAGFILIITRFIAVDPGDKILCDRAAFSLIRAGFFIHSAAFLIYLAGLFGFGSAHRPVSREVFALAAAYLLFAVLLGIRETVFLRLGDKPAATVSGIFAVLVTMAVSAGAALAL